MRKRKDFVRLEGVRSARLVAIAGEGLENPGGGDHVTRSAFDPL